MSILTVNENSPTQSAMARVRPVSLSDQKRHISPDLSEEETRHETNPCSDEQDNSRDMPTTSEETEAEHVQATDNPNEEHEHSLNAVSPGQPLDVREGRPCLVVPSGYLAACAGGAETPGQIQYCGRRLFAADELYIPRREQQKHAEEHRVEYTVGGMRQPGPALQLAQSSANKSEASRRDQATTADIYNLSKDLDIAGDDFYTSFNRYPSDYAFPAKQASMFSGNSELPTNLATAAHQREAEQRWQRQHQAVQPQHEGVPAEEETPRATTNKGARLPSPQHLSPVLLAQLEQSQLCDTVVSTGDAGAVASASSDEALTAMGGTHLPGATASGPDSYVQWLTQGSDMGIPAVRGEIVRLADDDEISFDLSSTDDWTEENGACFFQEGTSNAEKPTEHVPPLQTEVLAGEADEMNSTNDGQSSSRAVSTDASRNSSSATGPTGTEKAQTSALETSGSFAGAIVDSHKVKALPQVEAEMHVGEQKKVAALEMTNAGSSVSVKDITGEMDTKLCTSKDGKTSSTAIHGKQGNSGICAALKHESAARTSVQKRKSKKHSEVGAQKQQQRQQHVLPMQPVTLQQQSRTSYHSQHYRKRETSHEKRQRVQPAQMQSQSVFRQTQQGHLQVKQERQRREKRVEETSRHDVRRGDIKSATEETTTAEIHSRDITHDTDIHFDASEDRESATPGAPALQCPTAPLVNTSVSVSRGRSPPPPKHSPSATHESKQQQGGASRKSYRGGSSKSNSSHSSTRSPPARLPATQILKAISRMACEHMGKSRSSRGPCWNDLPPAAQRKVLEVLQQQKSLITCRAHIRKAVEAMQQAASSGVTTKNKCAAGASAAAAILSSATTGTTASGTTSDASANARRRGLYEQKPHGKKDGMRIQSTIEEKGNSSALRRGMQATAAAGGSRRSRGVYTYEGRSTDPKKGSGNIYGSTEIKRGRKAGSALSCAGTGAGSRSSSAAPPGVGVSSGHHTRLSTSTSNAFPGAAGRSLTGATGTSSSLSTHLGAISVGSAANSSAGELARGRKGTEKQRAKQRSSSWHRYPRRLGMSFSAHSLHNNNGSCNRLLCPHGLRYKSLCAHCGATGLLEQQGGSHANMNGAAARSPLHATLWDRKARSDNRNNKHVALRGGELASSSSSIKRNASAGPDAGGEKADHPVFERLWKHAVNKQRAHSAASLRCRNRSAHSSRVALPDVGCAAEGVTAAATPPPPRMGEKITSSADPVAASASEPQDTNSNSSLSPPPSGATGASLKTSSTCITAAPAGVSPGAAHISTTPFRASPSKAVPHLSLSAGDVEARNNAERRGAGLCASATPAALRKYAAGGARAKHGKMCTVTASTKGLSLDKVATKEKTERLQLSSERKGDLSLALAVEAAPDSAMGSTRSSSRNHDGAAADMNDALALNDSRGTYQREGLKPERDDRERGEKKNCIKGEVAAVAQQQEPVSSCARGQSSTGSAALPLFSCPVREDEPEEKEWQYVSPQGFERKLAEEQEPRRNHENIEKPSAKVVSAQQKQHQESLRASLQTQQQVAAQTHGEKRLQQQQQEGGVLHGDGKTQGLSSHIGKSAEQQWQQQWKRQQEMWLTAAYLHHKNQQEKQLRQQQSPFLVYNHAVPSPWQPGPENAAAAAGNSSFPQKYHSPLIPVFAGAMAPSPPPFAVVAPSSAARNPTLHPSEDIHRRSSYTGVITAADAGAAAPAHVPSPQMKASAASRSKPPVFSSPVKETEFLPYSLSVSQPAESLHVASTRDGGAALHLRQQTQQQQEGHQIQQQKKHQQQTQHHVQQQTQHHVQQQTQHQVQQQTHYRRSSSFFPQRPISGSKNFASSLSKSMSEVCINKERDDSRQRTENIRTRPLHAGQVQKKSNGETAISHISQQQPSKQQTRSVPVSKPLPLQQQQKREKENSQEYLKQVQQQQQREWQQRGNAETRHSRGFGIASSFFHGRNASSSPTPLAAGQIYAPGRVRQEQLKSEAEAEARAVRRQHDWNAFHSAQQRIERLNVDGATFNNECKVDKDDMPVVTGADAPRYDIFAGDIRDEEQSVQQRLREEERRSNSESAAPINLSNWCVQDLRIETRPMPHAGGKKLPTSAPQKRKTLATEKKYSNHIFRESPSSVSVGIRRPLATPQQEHQKEPKQYHGRKQGASTTAVRQQHKELQQQVQAQRGEEKRDIAIPALAMGEENIDPTGISGKKMNVWQQAWQQQQLRWCEAQSQQAALIWRQQQEHIQQQQQQQQQQHVQHQQDQHYQQNQTEQIWQQQLWMQPQQGGKKTLKEEEQGQQQLWHTVTLPLQQHEQIRHQNQRDQEQREREQQRRGNRDASATRSSTPVACKAHPSIAPQFFSMNAQNKGNRKRNTVYTPAKNERGYICSSSNDTLTSSEAPVSAQGWPEAAAALADCLAEEAAQGCPDAAAHLIACSGIPLPSMYALNGNSTAPGAAAAAAAPGSTHASTAVVQQQQEQHMFHSSSHPGATTHPEKVARAMEEIAMRSGFLRRRRSRSRQSEGAASRSPSSHIDGEKEEETKKKKGLTGWLPFL